MKQNTKIFGKSELDGKYQEARANYAACVLNDRSALQKELEIPLGEIVLRDDRVSLIFLGNNDNYYRIETKLTLNSKDDEEIGYYALIESDNGEVIDDFLVFY